MQCQAKAHGFFNFANFGIDNILVRVSIAAAKASITDFCALVRTFYGKHGQQTITHKVQDFATIAQDDRHLAIEISIEKLDHDLRRQSVRESSESAHVRKAIWPHSRPQNARCRICPASIPFSSPVSTVSIK